MQCLIIFIFGLGNIENNVEKVTTFYCVFSLFPSLILPSEQVDNLSGDVLEEGVEEVQHGGQPTTTVTLLRYRPRLLQLSHCRPSQQLIQRGLISCPAQLNNINNQFTLSKILLADCNLPVGCFGG